MLRLADKGLSTAAIGKLGPTLMFDHTDRTGRSRPHSIMSTTPPAPSRAFRSRNEMQDALKTAGLPLIAPLAGHAGRQRQRGNSKSPAHWSPISCSRNISPTSPPRSCCRCSRNATSRSCWCSGRAIRMAAQHNQGDSLEGSCQASTDRPRWPPSECRRQSRAACARRWTNSDLAATTDIVVAADHGFSTISKESKTSPAAQASYADVADRLAAARLRRDRSRQSARSAAVRS